MLTTDPVAGAAADLRRSVSGPVVLAGEDGYDAARAAWNLSVDQQPALVATPADPAEVAEVVRFARAHGLRVAVQGTGHGARARGAVEGTVLLRTDGLRGIAVDPVRRTARVAAGEVWEDVIAAAARHELAAPHGSAPDVGVVGYTLGGGLGWFARRHGLAANGVVAMDVVTADGEQLRVDADHHPEVFWALRGGGARAVVTAIEFALHPVSDLSAGALFFDLCRAPAVLPAWHAWTRTAPPSVTSTLKLIRVPDLPHAPELLRGRQWCVVMAAVLDRPAAADALVAPLRALGPDIDTFAPAPLTALARLAMDPPVPVPATSTSMVIDALTDAGIDALLEVAGPGVESPLPVVELRQLGGALAEPVAGGGALSALPGAYLLFSVGMLAPPVAAASEAHLDLLEQAMAPWDSGRRYLNMCERRVDPATAYRPAAWSRLRAVREAMDPDGTFLTPHAAGVR